MAKVYVSSTIADLKQERQAVMDWLVAAGHQPVHSYRPDSETVRDSCLDDVDTCDLYVLILGYRYGFLSPADNPEGLSITQLEFRRAGQSGIPRVALLRTSIPDVSVSDMENPERAARVLAFRQEVAREVRPALFEDKAGLIQGLSTGVAAELAKRSADAAGAARALRLALPPALLAGREDLLAELDSRLAAGGGAGPRVVALYGLAGAGKTSVALAYAQQHLAETGIAWQLAAEDPAVLAAGFGELVAQLGARDGGDPVASVHAILADYPTGWLLLFDNAPDPEAVARFMPPGGAGRVLITSRNALWPHDQAVEVPALDLGAAAGFLAARTGDADHQAAAGLAAAVGGCRWRWSRPPPTSRPPGIAWPGTWNRSTSGGRTFWHGVNRPGTAGRWTLRGRWRSPSWRSQRRGRRGCCGCWRSAPPTRSRWACCCNLGRSSRRV